MSQPITVKPFHEVPWHSIASTEKILEQLGTSLDGLSPEEATKRLQEYASHTGRMRRNHHAYVACVAR